MKQLFVLIVFGILLGSCSRNEAGKELRLDGILSCGNPNLDINHGQVEEWKSSVISFLAAEGFTVLDSRLDHEEIEREGIFCGNCWPTGDQLFVTVPDEQQVDLMALGFYKE